MDPQRIHYQVNEEGEDHVMYDGQQRINFLQTIPVNQIQQDDYYREKKMKSKRSKQYRYLAPVNAQE